MLKIIRNCKILEIYDINNNVKYCIEYYKMLDIIELYYI